MFKRNTGIKSQKRNKDKFFFHTTVHKTFAFGRRFNDLHIFAFYMCDKWYGNSIQ